VVTKNRLGGLKGRVGKMELVFESQIDGNFYGMDGSSVYILTNGHIYQQSQVKYQYCYSYCPSVKIWKDHSQYFLDVDGMNEMIEVKKVTGNDP
jgi:hypothetical protein